MAASIGEEDEAGEKETKGGGGERKKRKKNPKNPKKKKKKKKKKKNQVQKGCQSGEDEDTPESRPVGAEETVVVVWGSGREDFREFLS